MFTNKLIIVPVKLDSLPTETASFQSFEYTAGLGYVIKTTQVEIAFFNGIDLHIIQTIMKKLIIR